MLLPLLRPHGLLVASHISWLRDDVSGIPKEAYEYWTREYPRIRSVSQNISAADLLGYDVMATIRLPGSDWWNYLTPIQAKNRRLAEKYKGVKAVEETLAREQTEVDIYRKYSEDWGYVFYVLRKRATLKAA
eukprot:g29892.t1